jgi:hypothetical protein
MQLLYQQDTVDCVTCQYPITCHRGPNRISEAALHLHLLSRACSCSRGVRSLRLCASEVPKSEVEGAATLVARRSLTELCVRFGVCARPATQRTRSRRAAKVECSALRVVVSASCKFERSKTWGRLKTLLGLGPSIIVIGSSRRWWHVSRPPIRRPLASLANPRSPSVQSISHIRMELDPLSDTICGAGKTFLRWDFCVRAVTLKKIASVSPSSPLTDTALI